MMKTQNNHTGVVLWPILAVVLALLVGAGAAAIPMSRRQTPPEINGETIAERLEYVGDLVSLEYYYQNVASIDKAKIQVWGLNIPFTGSRAIFTYEGIIKYGITIRDVTVDVTGDVVTLTVPESKVVSHDLPPESIEFFDVGRNAFNPVTIEDYVAFQVEQKAEMEAAAVEKGLPAAAQENAGDTLYTILSAMPGMEQYTVTVVPAKPAEQLPENEADAETAVPE